MNVQLYAAPTSEPITLAEANAQLNIDSGTSDATQSLSFGSHAIADNYTTHVGTGVDVLGKQAEVLLHCGTNGATGTNDTRIEEADAMAGPYTAWTGGSFPQITTANDNADYKLPYTGTKRYIRTASKVLLAACEFGTSILANAGETASDTLLTSIIKAAREQVEKFTRRQLLTATWDYYLYAWQDRDRDPDPNAIRLPFGNLQTVSSVSWKDQDGTETILTPGTDYIVETNGEGCGRIVLPYGGSWPSGTLYPSNPIKIRFVCGWTAAASIPESIKSAVKMIVANMWANRGEDVIGQTVVEDKAAARLLSSSRLWEEF